MGGKPKSRGPRIVSSEGDALGVTLAACKVTDLCWLESSDPWDLLVSWMMESFFAWGVTKPPLLVWTAPCPLSHSCMAAARWSGMGPEKVEEPPARGVLDGVLGVEHPDLIMTPSSQVEMNS
jgi:hypothetical protein